MKIIVVNKKEEQIGSTFILQENQTFQTGQTITHSDTLFKIENMKIEFPHYIYLFVKKVKL